MAAQSNADMERRRRVSAEEDNTQLRMDAAKEADVNHALQDELIVAHNGLIHAEDKAERSDAAKALVDEELVAKQQEVLQLHKEKQAILEQLNIAQAGQRRAESTTKSVAAQRDKNMNMITDLLKELSGVKLDLDATKSTARSQASLLAIQKELLESKDATIERLRASCVKSNETTTEASHSVDLREQAIPKEPEAIEHRAERRDAAPPAITRQTPMDRGVNVFFQTAMRAIGPNAPAQRPPRY
ncbi:hypothetical protein FRB94_010856 [Tulasnella sp. JGI-2019a]|nr:hypothetical protein FRB94_010856 [Tulasnella sp. JGI-2019a]